VDDAKWVSDWVKVAQHYAGNDTVIGYDLWNEPTNYGKGSNWGSDDPLHDIRLAYERAGRAIQAVDSDKLIIAEGSQDYSTGAPQGDLRGVRTYPVRLTVPNKVVYSVHEYPASVAGSNKLSDGQAYCTQMKSVWGYLVMEDIAPVWIGENGASMNNAGDQAWAETIISCLDGMVTAAQQPPGGDWWMWDHCDDCGNPNGALQADRKTVKPEQAAVFTRMVQRKRGKAVGSAVAYGNQVSQALGATVQLAAGEAGSPDALPAQNQDATTPPPATATTPALAAMQKQTAASIAEADALIARVTAGRGK
jgi:aryl-phospho-beta-D-glucosidase BglC (GH1 family)